MNIIGVVFGVLLVIVVSGAVMAIYEAWRYME